MLTHAGFSAYISRFPASISHPYAAQFPESHPHFLTPATLAEAVDHDFINAPASHVMAQEIFIRPARRLAEAMSTKGKCDVYVYRCRSVVDRVSLAPFNLGSMFVRLLLLVFRKQLMLCL